MPDLFIYKLTYVPTKFTLKDKCYKTQKPERLMERRNTVDQRSNRTVVYDRTLVVPHRQKHGGVAYVAPKKSLPQVESKSPNASALRSSDNVYFDMKPAQKPHRKAGRAPEPHQHAPSSNEPMMFTPLTQADIAAHRTVQPMMRAAQPQRIYARQPFAKQYLLYGMAVVVFIIGVGASVQGWLANQAVTTQASVLSQHVTRSDDESPSEVPPQVSNNYSVAPELPRMISIPAIQVNARILHLGVDDKNVLKSPSNIFDTGWYLSSARPSDTQGAMLIDGHVSGPTKHGVFYDIKKLKKGDEIIVERGDTRKDTFEVQEVVTTLADDVDMAALLRSVDETKLGLNLITCGGRFNAETNTFESRTQVFAVKKSP